MFIFLETICKFDVKTLSYFYFEDLIQPKNTDRKSKNNTFHPRQ